MKTIKLLFALASLVVATSCISVDYLGKSYAPTTNVDLFFDQNDITKEYEVMGTINAEMPEWMNMEKLQERLIEKAREKGADAVLVADLEKQVTGSTSMTNGNGGPFWGSTTSTNTERVSVVTAKLLKYKQ